MKDIRVKCPKCGGTGTEVLIVQVVGGEEFQAEEITCRKCLGAGFIPSLHFSDELETFLNDLKDKVNDVMDKCNDIFEKVSE